MDLSACHGGTVLLHQPNDASGANIPAVTVTETPILKPFQRERKVKKKLKIASWNLAYQKNNDQANREARITQTPIKPREKMQIKKKKKTKKNKADFKAKQPSVPATIS